MRGTAPRSDCLSAAPVFTETGPTEQQALLSLSPKACSPWRCCFSGVPGAWDALIHALTASPAPAPGQGSCQAETTASVLQTDNRRPGPKVTAKGMSAPSVIFT